MENKKKKKLKLFYWWDTQSGNYLEERKGCVRKRHGLYMYGCPQGFSLWKYTP